MGASIHHHRREHSQVLLNGLHQSGLGHRADDGVHLLAALEDHDGGNAANAVLGCNLWQGVRKHRAHATARYGEGFRNGCYDGMNMSRML